jgi:hypothetical protein
MNQDLKPTERAELLFNRAAATAFTGYAPRGRKTGISPADLANVLQDIGSGLQQMAVGLRATYLALQQANAILNDIDTGVNYVHQKEKQ